MQPSLKTSLLRLAPASLLVLVLSFGSSIVLATQLGASTKTDAYYLALSVPTLVYAVLLAGIRLGGIPVLTRISQTESKEALDRACGELVSATVVASACLSILTTAVMLLVLPAAAQGNAELTRLTRLFLIELLPYAVTGALLGTLGSILAIRGRFAIVTLSLVFEPLLKSALLLGFRPQLGVQALLIGAVVGNLIAVMVLWAVVRRTGIRPRLAGFRNSSVVRAVFKLSAPLVISQAALQLNPLIDKTTAASLGAGSITELELGIRLFTAPTALLTGMMIAPLTASWATRLIEDGWQAVMNSFRRVLAAVSIALPPLVLVGFVLRHQLVMFVYSSHRYTPIAVSRTADVLGALLLGLIPMILIVPLSTLFVIRGDTIVPMKIGLANCVINAVLDIVFRAPLGVAGIAASTSVTQAVLCVVYVVAVRGRWGRLGCGDMLRRLMPLVGASLVAISGAVLLAENVIGSPQSRLGELALLAGLTGLAVVIHCAVVTAGGGWGWAGVSWPRLRVMGWGAGPADVAGVAGER